MKTKRSIRAWLGVPLVMYDEVIGLHISALAHPDQGHVIARSFQRLLPAPLLVTITW